MSCTGSSSASMSILNFFSPAATPAVGATNDIPGTATSSASIDEESGVTVAATEVSETESTSTHSDTTSFEEPHLRPNQPKRSVFPPARFGAQTKSFQYGWFEKWKWLDWDDNMCCVFCHPCRMAARLHFNLSKNSEAAFSTAGFRNWKDATRSFRKHESSSSHSEAALKWVHYFKSQSIAVQLNKQLLSNQVVAQGCLLKIISTLRYLARQGLATRGHIESEGNFLQLLQLRSEESPELSSWLERREKWLSHDIQNELFEIMAHFVLKIIEFCETKQIFHSYC